MSSQSLNPPTRQDHEAVRRRFISLSWQLWREQYAVGFHVWHPLPEEHLAIEVHMFWRGEITQLGGWTDILGQILRPINDMIGAIISWFWENIIRPGIDVLLGVIRWVLNGIQGVVSGIAQTLSAVWTSIATAITGLLTRIGEGVAWLGSELTKATGWIWQQLQGFFSALGEVLKQIGTWILNAIKTFVVDPILALLQPVFEGLKTLIMGIWNFITQGAITGSPVEWRGSFTRWIGIISGVGIMAVSGLVGAELINLLHPFKDTKAGELAKFAMQFSGFAFLMSAFYGTYFDIACAKPVRQELNSIFTPELPGSGDLIRFVVREVIVPDEFHMAMSLQGFSRYWSAAYWEAHWLLPPPERTRTAFLRKQIPEEAYRKFLIWYDFKPEPRPGIPLSDVDIMLATQYDWPGRIEARWMLEWGQITETEAEDLLKADGLDPAWSPKVARAYLLNQMRDEYNRVRTALMTRYKEGFLKTEAFSAALKALNFANHTIEATIKWANEVATWDEIWEQAQEWWRLAKKGSITPETYADEVRKLGMMEERITGKIHLLQKLAVIAAVEAAEKTPRK